MSNWDQYNQPRDSNYPTSNGNQAIFHNSNTTYYNSGSNNYYSNNSTPYNVYTVDQIESQHYSNTSNNEDTQGISTTTNTFPDISKSTLTPTAKEFKPSSSGNSSNANGAVKKNMFYNKWNDNQNDKKNKTRYFNSYRYNDKNASKSNKLNYTKSYNHRTDHQNKVLKDVSEFLNKDEDKTVTSHYLKSENVLEENKKDNVNKKSNDQYGYKKDYYKSNYNRKGYYVNDWRKSYQESTTKYQNSKKKFDIASQRERLEEMINRKMLECLVCCEKIRHTDYIWSCKQCYHIFHLSCIIKWAKASKLELGWRCPACQNVCSDVPNEYYCYCGQVQNPQIEQGMLPHSCGEVCRRKGRSCDHKCTLLCHPGPCPECNLMVAKSCGCGGTKPLMKCSSDVPITCQNVCNKLLNCKEHKCKTICHIDDCKNCSIVINQQCFCGKEQRTVPCSSENNNQINYECDGICNKTLSCGNHNCLQTCHSGDCGGCSLGVDEITTCPCGQSLLNEKRTSCLDPIKCCDKICNKPLKCGQPSSPHLCKNVCHNGPCLPCPLTTFVRCRCGHMDREIVCVELKTKADDARCEKKCTKKRQCAKHKCNQLCCIEIEHVCPLPCNRMLTCGLHRCEETCHKGRCAPCWRTSFQELYCECGSSVLYPPIACGTRPPNCNKPCSRVRPCGHEVHHNCHSGPCPPCTIFCRRWCHGKHEQRGTIPCHQEDFSCGLPCGKELTCKRHKCLQPCHSGPCRVPCTQPCKIIRSNCGHPCNQPCHVPPCPETPCKQQVKVTCECGLRSSSRICMELSGEYQSIALSQLASKMAEIQRGQTVDITDIVSNQKKSTIKTLECTEECRVIERNRRLAIGLQIRNPDLSQKLTPRYSDYMRNWGKKDPKFCQHVHDKLSELVQLAKQSKQKSRSYSFESMNKDKRHFVHEYCEHFGCESAAYDQEPNRNVVATALRDKSWLPSMSILELLQRENGQRKVPGPVLSKSANSKSEIVSLRLPGKLNRPSTPPGEYVDYFNDPPT